MVNNAALEAICSATYLFNYLDTMETLPDDLQRNISQMRELHIRSKAILDEIKTLRAMVLKESGSSKKSCLALQRALIHCQEIGDEKIALVQLISDLIENRSRQLDQDREHLDPGSTKEPEPEEVAPPVKKEVVKVEQEKPEKPAAVKRQRRQKNDVNEEEVKVRPRGTPSRSDCEEKEKPPKKKKKRKVTKKEVPRDDSPLDFQIDPNEPTYCSCNNVSYGEMIGCDNEKCVIEWFHFGCVGLRTKPKGKWFCPNCRGDKPNVRRSDK
ncbi:inhibitor of growth protein [Plakobranchus ocellatus]|uniref:Inhibitor of growth protein n=1 Tax=Plakobranchus ocellatus TaxID=259542 RepID=A0AAV4AWZ7_9GAST|nr:inhibitor of growth protein [Plakobranchus ocellatus]